MQSLSRATKRPSDQSRCAREVMDAVPQVMWFVRREMRGNRGGLSLAQFRTLQRIRRQPTINLSVLADHLGVSLPSASRMVTGLVEKGLLGRKGNLGDRRQMALALTRRGEGVLEAARRATQQCVESQISSLSGHQRTTLMEAMDVLKRCFASDWVPPNGPLEETKSENGHGHKNGSR